MDVKKYHMKMYIIDPVTTITKTKPQELQLVSQHRRNTFLINPKGERRREKRDKTNKKETERPQI